MEIDQVRHDGGRLKILISALRLSVLHHNVHAESHSAASELDV